MFRIRLFSSMLAMLMITSGSPMFAQLLFEDTFPGGEGGAGGFNTRWTLDDGGGSMTAGGNQASLSPGGCWDGALTTQGGSEGPYNRTNGGNVMQLTVDSNGIGGNFMYMGLSSVGALPTATPYNGGNGVYAFTRVDNGKIRMETPANGGQFLPGESTTTNEYEAGWTTNQAFSIRFTAGSSDGFMIEADPGQSGTWQTLADFRNTGLYSASGSADAQYNVSFVGPCGSSTVFTRVRLEHVAPPAGPFFDNFPGTAGVDTGKWGTIDPSGSFTTNDELIVAGGSGWERVISTEAGFGELPRADGSKVLQVTFVNNSISNNFMYQGLTDAGALAANGGPDWHVGTAGIAAFPRADSGNIRVESPFNGGICPEISSGGSLSGASRVRLILGSTDGAQVLVDPGNTGSFVEVCDNRNTGHANSAAASYAITMIGPYHAGSLNMDHVHATYVDPPASGAPDGTGTGTVLDEQFNDLSNWTVNNASVAANDLTISATGSWDTTTIMSNNSYKRKNDSDEVLKLTMSITSNSNMCILGLHPANTAISQASVANSFNFFAFPGNSLRSWVGANEFNLDGTGAGGTDDTTFTDYSGAHTLTITMGSKRGALFQYDNGGGTVTTRDSRGLTSLETDNALSFQVYANQHSGTMVIDNIKVEYVAEPGFAGPDQTATGMSTNFDSGIDGSIISANWTPGEGTLVDLHNNDLRVVGNGWNKAVVASRGSFDRVNGGGEYLRLTVTAGTDVAGGGAGLALTGLFEAGAVDTTHTEGPGGSLLGYNVMWNPSANPDEWRMQNGFNDFSAGSVVVQTAADASMDAAGMRIQITLDATQGAIWSTDEGTGEFTLRKDDRGLSGSTATSFRALINGHSGWFLVSDLTVDYWPTIPVELSGFQID